MRFGHSHFVTTVLACALTIGSVWSSRPSADHASSSPPASEATEQPVGPERAEAHPFDHAAQAVSDDNPPLLDGLGTLSYRITTSSPLAQKYFDQGLRLTYAFNHAEARRAFRKAQRLDPECALCYWGEALVLGPNINAPMDPGANAPALEAVRKAQSVAAKATRREQALIDALAARYSAETGADRAGLDRAYAEAMGKVAAKYPKDDDIAVLYAESLMDLSPWDYWESGGAKPKGRTAEIVAVLERVLRRNPNHPGAIHYYIHMVEASGSPKRAEPYAERLAKLMPGAGHIVHMPAHIYHRVGRYKDSIEANRKAVEVDERYFAKVGRKPGIYSDAYYLHNVHFLMSSAQMAGDGRTAIEAAEKLSPLVSDTAAKTMPLVQPIKAAPYFAYAQFSDPNTILSLQAPGDELPYVKAAWHYARGIANTAKGDTDAALREADAISRIGRESNFADLKAAGIPAGEVLKVADHVIRGRVAQKLGDLRTAAAEFEAAIAVEDKLPYMEPPFWYYPVRQSLGGVQLMAGDLDLAEQSFRSTLERTPQNGWALYGLQEIYKRRGDTKQLGAVQNRLDRTWLGDKNGPGIDQL
ncbi:hypothetical protein [Methylocaldum sp.]|uniref:tetratricopeptide repeat protein n=1 Tax=Methylocaldum sp. TaxID=1969727 RepID=UPI002D462801|nr:hypothetical protein [Methylocaldum sp.]HYE37777.1 hypothetical protein [Methylocaldum sp.]